MTIPRTVGAIASRLGLEQADHPVDARTMPDHVDRRCFAEIVADNSVFGRVTPHQKRAMVGSLQAAGRTVAMTGDGVNDVLALKDADIGVAMGSGSDATRAVAQLVLLENKFAVLPSVVAEGRKVIGNIERVAKLFLTKIGVRSADGGDRRRLQVPFPFLPRHLTVVTALTIGIPAFLLALAPNRDVVAPNMVARVLRFSVPAGVIAAALLVFLAGRVGTDTTLVQDRTTATIALFLVGWARWLPSPGRWCPGRSASSRRWPGASSSSSPCPHCATSSRSTSGASRDTLVTAAIAGAGAVAVIVVGAHTIPRRTQ